MSSFSYVCRMFYFGSSHLFQHDFCEYEPNQNENETVDFVETNVETSDSDSEEFLSCDEGFDGHTHCKAMMKPLFVKPTEKFLLGKN